MDVLQRYAVGRGCMMHHDRPYPGKFEGNPSRRLAEALYNVVGQGFEDDSLGSVEDFGWYGIIRRPHATFRTSDGFVTDGIGYILSEDSQGFFSYERMGLTDADFRWNALETEYGAWINAVYPELRDSDDIGTIERG